MEIKNKIKKRGRGENRPQLFSSERIQFFSARPSDLTSAQSSQALLCKQEVDFSQTHVRWCGLLLELPDWLQNRVYLYNTAGPPTR